MGFTPVGLGKLFFWVVELICDMGLECWYRKGWAWWQQFLGFEIVTPGRLFLMTVQRKQYIGAGFVKNVELWRVLVLPNKKRIVSVVASMPEQYLITLLT